MKRVCLMCLFSRDSCICLCTLLTFGKFSNVLLTLNWIVHLYCQRLLIIIILRDCTHRRRMRIIICSKLHHIIYAKYVQLSPVCSVHSEIQFCLEDQGISKTIVFLLNYKYIVTQRHFVLMFMYCVAPLMQSKICSLWYGDE